MEAGIVIPVFFFLTVLLIWGTIILTRHKERMHIIEKGLSAEDMKALYTSWTRPASPLSSLKWGMLIAMVGLAILVGVWLHTAFYAEDGVYPGLIGVFGGLGLILFYRIASKKVNA
ncbi:MAG: DUF6249 domain-containing protein [Bacteroidota bacterium]